MFTKEEFKTATGHDLEIRLPEDNDETGKVNRHINQACDLVEEYIRTHNKSYSIAKLTDYQKEKLKKAEIAQALYLLAHPDLTLIGVYDEFNNIALPEVSFERFISPVARRTLSNAGLLYRGI